MVIQAVVVLGSAVLVGLLLGPAVRAAAVLAGVMDQPVHRKQLAGCAVPRLGGLVVFSATWAGVAVAILQGWLPGAPEAEEPLLVTLSVAGLLVLTLGAVDDRFDISARAKFLGILIVAGWVLSQGWAIERITLPGGHALQLHGWGLPLTIFWLVGVTNAVNLIDGVDGLAAGVGAVVAGGTAAIAGASGDVGVALLAAAVAGGCLGFLPYNYLMGKMFLGDCGSLFIGMSLAVLGLAVTRQTDWSGSFWVPVLLLGYPTLDTFAVMTRRFVRGKSIFVGDDGHIHHILLRAGFSQSTCAVIGATVSALCCLVAAGLMLDRAWLVTNAAIALGAGVVYAAYRLRHRWLAFPIDAREERTLFKAANYRARLAETEFELAPSMEALVNQLSAAGQWFGVSRLELIQQQAGGDSTLFAQDRILVVCINCPPQSDSSGQSAPVREEWLNFADVGLAIRLDVPRSRASRELHLERCVQMTLVIEAFVRRAKTLKRLNGVGEIAPPASENVPAKEQVSAKQVEASASSGVLA